ATNRRGFVDFTKMILCFVLAAQDSSEEKGEVLVPVGDRGAEAVGVAVRAEVRLVGAVQEVGLEREGEAGVGLVNDARLQPAVGASRKGCAACRTASRRMTTGFAAYEKLAPGLSARRRRYSSSPAAFG